MCFANTRCCTERHRSRPGVERAALRLLAAARALGALSWSHFGRAGIIASLLACL